MALSDEMLREVLHSRWWNNAHAPILRDALRELLAIRERAVASASATLPYVLDFAHGHMERKLAANRHKGDREGWLKDSPHALFLRLQEEVRELDWALEIVRQPSAGQDDRMRVASEAADVANFAMFIADHYVGLVAYGDGAQAPKQARVYSEEEVRKAIEDERQASPGYGLSEYLAEHILRRLRGQGGGKVHAASMGDDGTLNVVLK